MDVLPSIPLIFLAWFTYDVAPAESAQAANDGSPITKPNAQVGDDNHRWVTAQGAFAGDTAVLDVTLTTGGLFDDPQAVTNSEAGEQGTITLKFTDCKTASIEYDLTAAGLTGTVPIQRLADDNVDLCVALREQ